MFKNSFIFSKNHQKYFYHFALIYKHVIKSLAQISINMNYFSVLSFLPKTKNCILPNTDFE